jgi:hypothetical protein
MLAASPVNNNVFNPDRSTTDTTETQRTQRCVRRGSLCPLCSRSMN